MLRTQGFSEATMVNWANSRAAHNSNSLTNSTIPRAPSAPGSAPRLSRPAVNSAAAWYSCVTAVGKSGDGAQTLGSGLVQLATTAISTLRQVQPGCRRNRATPCRVLPNSQPNSPRASARVYPVGPISSERLAAQTLSSPVQGTGDLREPGKHLRYRFCSVLPAPVRGRHHHLDAAQAAQNQPVNGLGALRVVLASYWRLCSSASAR